MKVVWFEQNGPPEVMQIGEMAQPESGRGEVRIRVVSSGLNRLDWKRRLGTTAPMAFPRVTPH